VKQAVVRHVDHRHLNRDVPFLEGVVPTAENLALVFWRQLDGQMGSGHLQRLRLVESENNSVEVTR
jgi:6-pyruvoyltetrahydropterin/6-carboxytetrahydropterin synthase